MKVTPFKALSILAGLSMVDAAPGPAYNAEFPIYPSNAVEPYDYTSGGTIYDASLGGYKCIRNKYMYVVP